MAYILKKTYESYFQIFQDYADPRLNDYPILFSPIIPVVFLFLWTNFVFKWGPKYMKNRQPLELTKIMMVYNVIQILANGYVAVNGARALTWMDWNCSPIVYNYDYWPHHFLQMGSIYYVLKLLDLLDTVFFVLRKKTRHLSFLHCYHHFIMVIIGYLGARFLSGGHSFFFAFANTVVHTVLYSYYLLTAYNSKYSQLIWLKKFITQLQLIQFFFLMYVYTRLLMVKECAFPKPVVFLLIPQNMFMIVLFGDFYIRTYILEPRRKKKLEEQAKKNEQQLNGVSKAD